MQTYTVSNARQDFFKIVRNTSRSNHPTQITFHTKGKAQNNNVYLISQKQYNLLNKKLETDLIQRKINKYKQQRKN